MSACGHIGNFPIVKLPARAKTRVDTGGFAEAVGKHGMAINRSLTHGGGPSSGLGMPPNTSRTLACCRA